MKWLNTDFKHDKKDGFWLMRMKLIVTWPDKIVTGRNAFRSDMVHSSRCCLVNIFVGIFPEETPVLKHKVDSACMILGFSRNEPHQHMVIKHQV